MPIWPVSLTDGIYQVADADGALYPLTMGGAPFSRFSDGWTPRGLQTGVLPFYLLELEHETGETALWLHDDALDYRANVVQHLRPDDLASVLAAMDPVVITLNEECVKAAHAAIPAAVHQFDGLLPATVQALLGPSIDHVLPRPETVMLPALRALGTGYSGGGVSLTPGWIETALSSTEAQAQESFDLPGHRCQRHLDHATGLVFYVLQGVDAGDRHLFVPSLPAVFLPEQSGHDPQALLIVYYASNTNRVVGLPEMEGLHGLVEIVPLPQHEAMVEELEPVARHEAIVEPESGVSMPTYQAPRYAEPVTRERPYETAPYREPHDEEPVRQEPVYETTAYREPAVAQSALPADLPATHDVPDRPQPPAQNWWQKLLGLGNT